MAVLRHLERAFREGGSLSWTGRDRDHRGLPPSVVSIMATFLLGIVLVLALWSLQGAEQEALDFQCRPGETYTTKECP